MFREAYFYNITASLTAGTGVLFEEQRLAMNNFDFEFKRTIHEATSDSVYIKFFDNSTGRFLYKSYDDLKSVSGTPLSGITPYGFTPFNWPVPYLAKAKSILSIFLSDYSGAPNTVYLTYHGDAIKETTPLDMHGKPVNYDEQRPKVPIIYESPAIVATGAGAQVQDVVIIDNDSDFVCTKITGICTAAGFVTIQDLARDIYWQNDKTYMSNLFGNGQFPHVLTSPRFVNKNSRLLITWETIGAPANTLRLYFHGYKRF